jgi:outer membrane cobalamin receptor
LTREISVELIGNNLGDKRYETVRGYPSGGAAVLLNVRVEGP